MTNEIVRAVLIFVLSMASVQCFCIARWLYTAQGRRWRCKEQERRRRNKLLRDWAAGDAEAQEGGNA